MESGQTSFFTFQLTASRRGWQISLHTFTIMMYFNSQPHEEADGWESSCCYCRTYFNSQPHEEADYRRNAKGSIFSYFNSQPHEEADSCMSVGQSHRRWFQLTASRRGWRQMTIEDFLGDLFQLTASRRGWLTLIIAIRSARYFNSQPHEEADAGDIVVAYRQIYISTHSLTKRLTDVRPWRYNQRFISTHSLTKRLTAILHKNS